TPEAGTVAQVARIRVSTVLDAPPAAVWADLEDIGSHVEWMADAEAIRFVTDQTAGVGTTFECDTKVGPFRLTDVMEITEWVPGKTMGVRHTGVVTGTGRFTLKKARGGRTAFQWKERLVYPLWLGGPVGAFLSKPVLRWVWRRNLARLSARFAPVAPGETGRHRSRARSGRIRPS
ncbi:MAG: SRPBCC family protein, partial [Acidimicrobiales bacterium]